MYVSRIDALPFFLFLKFCLERERKGVFFLGGREMLTEDFLFLVISVAQVTQLGIGRDVWTLTPENIEKALKVSIQHFLSLPLFLFLLLTAGRNRCTTSTKSSTCW